MSIATEITRLQKAKADIKAALENKGVTVGDETIDTYAEKISEIEVGESVNVISEATKYMSTYTGVFSYVEFPEEYTDITVFVTREGNRYKINNCFSYSNATSIKLVEMDENKRGFEIGSTFRNTEQLNTIDLSEMDMFILSMNSAFASSSVKEIKGTLDLSQCTNVASAFSNCKLLEEIRFVPSSINISIDFSASQSLSTESQQSIIEGLADLTSGTAQVLTLSTDVKGNLTDAQITQITSKNWTLA